MQFYETLLEYIERMEQTVLAMAKIYPKTVFYYYETWKASGEDSRAERMLELCDKAIELLRNANRMFYLWELFCMREELEPKLPENISQDENFISHGKNCRDWRETLEELYQEYGVSIAMYEFCYLYVESENYCIGDVIRIRRKMLGLSQEKLSEGICDSRTVSRLERHIRKPQKEIVQQLFDRLNLSTELCRTELVTDSQEAIEKFEELGKQSNNQNFAQVEVIAEEIKKIISMKCPSNAQAIEKSELLSIYRQGKISREEYIKEIKKVLGYTVPYNSAIIDGEKYLTKEEIVCMQNILLEADWSFNEMKECVTALISLCENPKFFDDYVRMYEFIMIIVSSNLGDKGEYEQSNELKYKLFKMSLKNRRIKAIDSLIYGILWNNKQMINIGGNNNSIVVCRELNKCIRMCNLSKKFSNQRFYEEKIKLENQPRIRE